MEMPHRPHHQGINSKPIIGDFFFRLDYQGYGLRVSGPPDEMRSGQVNTPIHGMETPQRMRQTLHSERSANAYSWDEDSEEDEETGFYSNRATLDSGNYVRFYFNKPTEWLVYSGQLAQNNRKTKIVLVKSTPRLTTVADLRSALGQWGEIDRVVKKPFTNHYYVGFQVYYFDFRTWRPLSG